MNSKAMFAIVVAVIVVAGAVAIGVVFAVNNGNNTPQTTDHVKDGVHVGDYIKLHKKTITESEEYISESEFLDALYYDDYITDDIRKVTFDGREYDCCVTIVGENFGGTLTVFAVKSSGFILKEIYEHDSTVETKILTSVNSLDVSLKPQQQPISIGAEFTYEINAITVAGANLWKVTDYGYYSQGYALYKNTKEMPDERLEVTGISGDIVTLSSGERMSVQKFRSFVSEKDWRNENIGDKMPSEVKSRYDGYQSPWGPRYVNDDVLTLVTSPVSEIHYNIVYGTDGFLYYAETDTYPYTDTTQRDIVSVTETSMRV